MQIDLGVTVKDKITGFKGVVTGYVRYITGCDQVLVVPQVKAGANAEARWFDVQRVEQVGKSKITLDNSKTPGFDAPPPVR